MFKKLGWIAIMSMFVLPAVSAQTMVIAHRGYSSIAPENTLYAVKRAVMMEPQPQYIEIDLHQSSDGVLVVCHDAHTGRTTGKDWMIRETPFERLRSLSAGYAEKFGTAFSDEKLPRLEEVLDLVRDTPIGIMIECKQLLLEEPVLSLLHKRGEVEKHIIASFDALTVFRAKQLEPKAKTLYLNSSLNKTSIYRAMDVKADILGTHVNQAVDGTRLAKELGLDVWVWTVDEPDDIQRWAKAKADGIISNKPAVVYQVFRGIEF
jgi:glycerophosphoryl diester phosphodiesterase